MFNKSSCVAKYKAYTKFLQGIKTSLVKTNPSQIADKPELHTINKSIELCSKSLYSIQKLWEQKSSKAQFRGQVTSLAHKLLKNPAFLATGLVAAKNDPIPEPPPIPDYLPEPEVTLPVNQLNALGEATFASLGLGGGWTPVGWVQSCMEYFHVSLGLPWWEAIVLGTFIIRICMFPLVVLAQRNAAKMNNCMPQLQMLQVKLTDARQSGNMLEAARYTQELMLFMKEKNLNPLKNMIVPFAQMPVFISFFMALRKMANLPVDSLKTGGLWWFQDLTIPDQYYIMPLITSVTLYATIELGTDTAKLSSQNMQTMKYVLRALPVCILPFIVNFPGVILCYWVSSNFISLAQVGFLRIPAVRDYFKIEASVNYKPEELPIKPKGFTEGIKDSWTNMKIANELAERRRLDEMQFQRAGKGPLVKTYKYDPTKQMSAVSAKKR